MVKSHGVYPYQSKIYSPNLLNKHTNLFPKLFLSPSQKFGFEISFPDVAVSNFSDRSQSVKCVKYFDGYGQNDAKQYQEHSNVLMIYDLCIFMSVYDCLR